MYMVPCPPMLKYHLVPFSASKLQSLHSSILAHPLCMCMYGVADLPNDRMEAAVVVQLITGPPFVYVCMVWQTCPVAAWKLQS